MSHLRPWLVAAGAAVAAALLVLAVDLDKIAHQRVMGAFRVERERAREAEEGRRTFVSAYPHRVHVHRPQIIWRGAVIVLAVAVIALAAWIVVDRSTGTSSPTTQEATTLIDELNAAWSAGDASAVTALFARDGVARLQGHTFVGARAIGDHAATASGFAGFRLARTAPVSVAGEFATTLAEYRYGGSSGLGTLLTVYQLREGKILREWTFKLGATEPFTSAAP